MRRIRNPKSIIDCHHGAMTGKRRTSKTENIHKKKMDIAIVGTWLWVWYQGPAGRDGVECDMRRHQRETKSNQLLSGNIPYMSLTDESWCCASSKKGALHFTTDLDQGAGPREIVFSAGHPPDEGDGSADLVICAGSQDFFQHINKYTLLVTKSTVPVGTARKLKLPYRKLDKRG